MDPVRVISDELILVDWGPMTLSVSAWADGLARPVMAAQAAREALRSLAALADFQTLLKKPLADLPPGRNLPPVVAKAVAAVRAVSGGLTPLAAVAGAAADQVADRAAALGADRVIVNNGGDIALRLTGNSRAVVGIKPPQADDLVGRLELAANDGVGGVATSGWQGRSHSLGVADLVCVWAASAALADAAATHLASSCDAAGAAVEQVPARQLDPGSDLGDRPVTVAVGRLNPDQRRAALTAGRRAAEALAPADWFIGCLIEVQGERLVIDPYDLAGANRSSPQ